MHARGHRTREVKQAQGHPGEGRGGEGSTSSRRIWGAPRAAAESCVTASAAMPMTASRQTAVVIRLRRVRAFTATAGTGTRYFAMVSGAGRGGLRSGGAMCHNGWLWL